MAGTGRAGKPSARQGARPTGPSEANETPGAALARLYDLDLSEDPGDLDLWLALAARTGGPVLELMAGTGRVAVPLAAAGYRVTAVDRDPDMLARARAAARAAGRVVERRLSLVEADVDGLRLPDAGGYGLAIIALGSILLLADRRAQLRAWETLAEHLAPGGIAAVDAWLPDGDDLARFDGRLALEWVRTDDAGRVVTKTASARHDPTTAAVELTTVFDAGRPGEPAARWIRTDRLRLVDGDDLAAMAVDAGLVVEALAGDRDLSPLAPGAGRAIVVASRPTRRRRR